MAKVTPGLARIEVVVSEPSSVGHDRQVGVYDPPVLDTEFVIISSQPVAASAKPVR
jgi:hypothetical protein